MPNDRITWFECNYHLINNEAMENATVTTSSLHPESNIDLLLRLPTDEQYIQFYDLNYSLLNNSLREIPNDWQPAFISEEVSDSNGEFSSPVFIQVDFSVPQNSYGISLNFNGDCPVEIEVTIEYEGGVERVNTFYPDSNKYVIPLELLEITTIKIEFIKALPGRSIALNSLIFGQIIYWGENDISDGNLLLESNIIGDKISINTLNFNVIDKNNSYNLANNNGLHRYFQKKQKAFAYEYINGEKKFLGKYFLDNFSWDSNLVSLNCVSYLGWLDDTQFIEGDIYNGVTAGVLLTKIFEVAGITEYTIDSLTYNTQLYGTLKPQSCRDALQEILFACNSNVRTINDVGIEIYKINNSLLDTIYRRNKISTKITKNDYVYGVDVHYTTYSLNTDELDEIVSEEEYQAGTHTIMFNGAYDNIKITSENTTITPDILKRYYCVFTLDSPKTITITGNIYIENVLSAKVTNDYLESGETETIEEYSTTMCNNTMALNKAKEILDQLQYRLTLDVQTITEDFSLDGRWWVQNPNPEYAGFIAWYTSRNLNLTGGFIDTAKMTGYYYDYNDYYRMNSALDELYAGESVGIL